MSNESGQTLMELIVVISVSVIVVAALVFATISSLRNAQFAKNQAQATKLAQEGIERVRVGRDKNLPISILGVDLLVVNSWNGTAPVWNYQISGSGRCDDSSAAPAGKCYFNVDASGSLEGKGFRWTQQELPAQAEKIPPSNPIFQRIIALSDNSATFGREKTVTSIVSWSDFSGEHESRLTTILRKK